MTEYRTGIIRQYEILDLNDLLTAWAAASEIAHPFLSQDFLDTERDNIPNLYLPNAETWVDETGFERLDSSEIIRYRQVCFFESKNTGFGLLGQMIAEEVPNQ